MDSIEIFIILSIISLIILFLFIYKYLYYFKLKSIKLSYFNFLKIKNYLKESQKIKAFLNNINNDEYLKKFEEINNVLLDNSITIGVIGDQKSGKSSLINAIIKTKLLPEGVTPVNNCLIEIKHGSEININVKFNKGNIENIPRDHIKHYCDENINTNNHKDVNLISIEYPLEHLKESVVLVDTPGLNSVFSYHTSITNNFITNSPILIYVISLEYPLSKTQKDFIEKLLKLNIVKIYYVFSKKDLIKDDYQRLFEFNNNEINKIVGCENLINDIISVSSKEFFDGLNSNNNKIISNSNIPQFVNSINDFICSDYFNIQLIYFKNSIINLLNSLKNDIDNEMTADKKSIIDQTTNADTILTMKNNINDLIKTIANTTYYLNNNIIDLSYRCELKIREFQNFLHSGTKNIDDISSYINYLNHIITESLDNYYQEFYSPILFNLKDIQTTLKKNDDLIHINQEFNCLITNCINNLKQKLSEKMNFSFYDNELITNIIKAPTRFEKLLAFFGCNKYNIYVDKFVHNTEEKFKANFYNNIIADAQFLIFQITELTEQIESINIEIFDRKIINFADTIENLNTTIKNNKNNLNLLSNLISSMENLC